MSKTYVELLAEIEDLKRQVQSNRQAEIGRVIKDIREAIRFYGLTAEDMQLNAPNSSLPSAVQKTKKAKPNSATPARYSDGIGQTWVGRGRRPNWLVEAIASGKTIDDFAI